MSIRGLSTRLHTPLDVLVISLTRHPEQVPLLPAQSPAVYLTDAHYSPRATLPVRWCYRLTAPCQPWSQSELPDHHRSSWLMRQTTILLPTSVFPISTGLRRLLRAPAGIWPFPTLSLRSLYGRLNPYPGTTQRCFSSVSSRWTSASP